MTATHLHFDAACGLSGDMTLGALVDLGVAVEDLARGLARLPIGPFSLRAEPAKRAGVMGTRVHVEVQEEPRVHRHLRQVEEIVEAAALPPRALARAKDAYRRLAEAEAQVHGSTPEAIHFHEVGAKDAIVDVAGAMLGVELLGAETFSASPVVVGFGSIECLHGRMPVPGPATALLLRGMPIQPGALEGEMTTPTGAAILATLLGGEGGRGFVMGAAATPRVARRIGHGAGSREYPGVANYLRLELCDSWAGADAEAGARAATPLASGAGLAALPVATETIRLLECEIDDMTPQAAGWLLERLMEAGALDAHWQPVQMKKNRPGLRLRVLAAPEAEARLAELIFRETPTLGLRRQAVERWALERRAEQVQTDLGPVAVKVALWEGRPIKAAPEYASCAELARRHGLPLAEVMDRAREAIRAWLARQSA
jgi:uncharacterized protein (TIGR00299 family) protein